MQLNLIIPATCEEIATETIKLRREIYLRLSEIEILKKGLDHYMSQCKHPGQKTGYNERDGSWANPCPVCGESH